ncbi:MAG: hypothetical protein WBO70_02235 [Erysipelotrichaceae bacterium]
MAKRKSNKFTAGKYIIDVFRNHHAYSPDEAIKVETFKNIPLTSEVVAFTMGNFIKDGIVLVTGDDRYYFCEKAWKKLNWKINFAYVMVVFFPILVYFIVMFIIHQGDFSKMFVR